MERYYSEKSLVKTLTDMRQEGFFNKIAIPIVGSCIDTAFYRTAPAKVKEVEYAYWLNTDEGPMCSRCRFISSLVDKNLKSNYCPWCGREMMEWTKL